ncbi:MAG: serine protease [Actinomycetota bacterium]|nr:serine protease [Actinomycetota bacterium]
MPPTQQVPQTPAYGAPGGPPPGMPPTAPPGYGGPGGPGGSGPGGPGGAGKSKKSWLIGGGVAAALLAGGIAVAVTGGDDSAGPSSTTKPVVVSTTTGNSIDDPVTTTVAPTTTEAGPLDIDTIARSVVQILASDADGNGLWTGSGTIISADGLILTNAHVVTNSDEARYETLTVLVTESADRAPTPTYQADVVGWDPVLDLAVVKISADADGNPLEVDDLPFLKVGDSDAIGLGDHLRIFGYPGIGGDTITFTEGSVSGFTSEAGVDADRAWVKTDATIAGGNSGGTAVNDDGELVAVPTRASATEGDITDCRVVQDTNGDGTVDENDSCIPIGGFINGLRPTNLASGVIEQGQLGEIVVAEEGGPIDVDTSGITLTPLVFSPDVTADDQPTEIVQALPTGAPRVCGFFDYSGMTDGATWDAVWNVNGELNLDYSLIAQEWVGGSDGINWWVCAGGGEAGLADGVYELSILVNGELMGSNAVFVGSGYSTFMLTVTNATASEVCFLRLSPQGAQYWGSDELGPDTTIGIGESIDLSIVGAVYDVRATDCDGNDVVEVYGVDLSTGGTLTLTP